MIVNAIKTHKITSEDSDLFKILDQYIEKIEENSVLAVTSKIVSITEGQLVPMDSSDKDELIKQESEYFLPRSENKYNVSFSIRNNMLVVSAGIDESNGNGFYILWPKNAQDSANKIRKYLRIKFKLKNLGVIITDSRTTPLRWGVTGAAIAYSGFKPLKDYIGSPDLFGRAIEHTKLNIADALATSAALVMGEAEESTPIAVIKEIPMVEFIENDPTKEELKELKIKMEDDLYYLLLKNAPWQKGGRG
jgi:dihydrofolate synthase / folylpolyglutamate synthase